MEQIRIEKGKRVPTDAEFIRWADDAAALVHRYGWEKRTIRPWSYPVTIVSIIEEAKEAPKSTFGSRGQTYLLAKGLTEILNYWEDRELHGVAIRGVVTGEVIKVYSDEVEFFLETGKFEVVK